MSYKLIIGSHVGMNKKNNYLIGSVKDSLLYGSNSFMIYTSSPQTTRNKPDLNEIKIPEFHVLLKENNIKIENVIIHASYLINIANTLKINVFENSLSLLRDEINRALKIGIKTIVLHPGSALNGNRIKSLLQIATGINMVLKPDDDIKIAIETMSGKGNEVGINFAELKMIYNNIRFKDKVGFCLDTCHLNDAGYDIKNNLDNILIEFDKILGIDKIFAIHLNDSKNILGSNKDRHENIGYGTIGFEALLKVAYHPKLDNIVKILETPYFKDSAPYKYEIENIRSREFKEFK